MLVSRHVRITGRVQGVFFRAWTEQQARALDVAGWVRNCPDGSVEAHLEGEQWPVQELIELLRLGPPAAQVDKVTDAEAEFTRADRFEVRS
jgi:acylphosphatase